MSHLFLVTRYIILAVVLAQAVFNFAALLRCPVLFRSSQVLSNPPVDSSLIRLLLQSRFLFLQFARFVAETGTVCCDPGRLCPTTFAEDLAGCTRAPVIVSVKVLVNEFRSTSSSPSMAFEAWGRNTAVRNMLCLLPGPLAHDYTYFILRNLSNRLLNYLER